MDLHGKYLKPADAAAIIGCSPRNIGLLREAGLLPGTVEIGPRAFLIPKKSVDAYAKKPRKRGRPKTISA